MKRLISTVLHDHATSKSGFVQDKTATHACAFCFCLGVSRPFAFSSPEPVVSWSRGLETRGSLQIKPSGSGDENGPFASDTSPKWIDREGRENAVQGLGKVFLRRQSNSEESALLSGPLRKQKVMVCDLWLVDFDPFCVFLGSLLLNFRVRLRANFHRERDVSVRGRSPLVSTMITHSFSRTDANENLFLGKEGQRV